MTLTHKILGDQKRLFLWLLLYLRILGLAPFVDVEGKCKKSFVYQGLSSSIHTISSVLTLAFILSRLRSSNSEIYEYLYNYWDQSLGIIMVTCSWHFLMSSTKLLSIVRFLNRSKASPLPVDWITYVIIGVNVIALVYASIENINLGERYSFNLVSIVNLGALFSLNFFLALFLSIVMKLFTCELANLTDARLTSTSSSFENTVKYIYPCETLNERKTRYCEDNNATRSEIVPESKKMKSVKESNSLLYLIKKKLISCNRTAGLIHSLFSVVVFALLAYEQVNMVLLVLYALYDSSPSHFWSLLFFTVPSALKLWLILDSQSGYIKVCQEGVHRVKRLIAEVGGLGPRYEQEVWQLRGILAELERMPRFTILGLFELGRHCLLAMGSVVLTYVTIAVQFTTSNNPVTCKPFTCNCSLC
ncbi:Gustatory receptor 47 [Hyalella azteca]|uniref:Gustatory receptor 47 n=1 Tax=Hyalella azteca TaxID=294128 RepID=A0A6A0GTR8_HYAAZ|nr:Gustatory receptor 47 [Hyalella azteca]